MVVGEEGGVPQSMASMVVSELPARALVVAGMV